MSAAQMVPMIAPDGTPGDVPYERMNEAKQAGFKPAVVMKSKDGQTGYVPADRYVDASHSGLEVVPFQQQDTQHAGFWSSLGSDLYAMIPKLKMNPYGDKELPGRVAAAEHINEKQKEDLAREDAERKAAGYGKLYRAAAPVGEGLGVNVPGMEQSAREGDAAGVIGHAAAVPTAMAITEGAGRMIPKAIRVTSEAAPKVIDAVRDVTPKQAAQVVAGGAGAVGGHGSLSVPAGTASAHYMGNIVESILGKERANAPIFPRQVKPVYPGAPQPTMPPEVAQAAALGQVPKTGALPASQTGEALAALPKTGEVAAPPQAASAAEPASAPSPTSEALPPSERTLTGESALRRILTGQDNANLMKIAKSRGINVTQEAQLKPGVADNKIINKIIESHSEEELQNVRDMYLENSRFKHNFGDIGPEAWKTLSMQSYFPEVKIPAAVLKRMESSVRNAKMVEQPTAGNDLTPLLQQSVEALKRRRATQ